MLPADLAVCSTQGAPTSGQGKGKKAKASRWSAEPRQPPAQSHGCATTPAFVGLAALCQKLVFSRHCRNDVLPALLWHMCHPPQSAIDTAAGRANDLGELSLAIEGDCQMREQNRVDRAEVEYKGTIGGPAHRPRRTCAGPNQSSR